MNLAEVTDDEWQLIKHAIGIDHGWESAYRLVSTLDLPGQDIPANRRLKALGALWRARRATEMRMPLVACSIQGVRRFGRVTPATRLAFLRRSMGGCVLPCAPGQSIGRGPGSQHSMAQVAVPGGSHPLAPGPQPSAVETGPHDTGQRSCWLE